MLYQNELFVAKEGPYLEAHHIVLLSKGSSDSLNNVVALFIVNHFKDITEKL